MRKTYLYYTLILLLCSWLSASAARLTVVIVADGWQADNLTLGSDAFQTDLPIRQWYYGGDEVLATLLTGELPAVHGMTAETYYSRQDRREHPFLEDKEESGLGCAERLSPRHLLCPTLTDRLRRLYGEQSRIYAVGLRPSTTVVMAGHSANACCWKDATTGRWATTSFYPEGLPAVADSMNMSRRLRLTEPRANMEVVTLALALQRDRKMGEDWVPDLLLLEMDSRAPKAQADLDLLTEQLDKRVGRTNYQLLLIGRAWSANKDEGDEEESFNVDQAAALTSAYLMAVYGHERWVDGGLGQAIFLNRELIEQKHMSLETIQRQVSRFLMEFENVQLACPQYEAYLNPLMSHSVNKRFAGDVVFTLQPQWNRLSPTVTVLFQGAGRSYYAPQELTALDINKLVGF